MNVSRFAPWIIAAGGILCAAWMFFATRAVRSQVDLLRIERDLAVVSERLMRTELSERTLLAERMINDLIAESGGDALANIEFAALASPQRNMRDARAVVLWPTTPSTAAQRAVLRADGLPLLAAEADYQLWRRHADDTPRATALGVFKPDARGRVAMALAQPISFAPDVEFFVTIEPAGGAAEPTGPVVLQRPR